MSNQPSQAGTTQVTTRKKRRGMIEKRRRDKINNSLCELRRLVPAAFEKQGSAKLEKAEILQMTVDYLRMLHARGLADHLTNKQPMRATPDESALVGQNQPSLAMPASLSATPAPLNGQPSSHMTPDANQLNTSATADNSDSNRTSISLSANHNHSIHPNQFDHHSHQQSHHLTAAVTSSPSLMHPAAASHHLYNQHHHMSAMAVEHATAAVAYHHLSNPLGQSDMGAITSVQHHQHANHSPNQHHQQQAANVKHQIKMDPHHQASLSVIPHSHPSLLNLDHHNHHHHHQAHHAHNPLSAHYGSHHSSASLAMNPYLAAAAAYPSMTAVSAAASVIANTSMDGSASQYEQQGQQQHHLDSSQVQQHLSQGQTNASPTTNDANGHQQVSSSSSPSDSALNASSSAASAASQRHYRPWGTELAY